MKALTTRELEVEDLIHQGLIEKEIAEKLFLSHGTVHTYKKRLFRKLHARNIADITRIYLMQIRPWLLPIIIILGLSVYAMISGVDFNDLMDSCINYVKKVNP